MSLARDISPTVVPQTPNTLFCPRWDRALQGTPAAHQASYRIGCSSSVRSSCPDAGYASCRESARPGLAVRVSWPAAGVAFVQGAGRAGRTQQPGRVPHHLPGIHALHAAGPEVLEPGHPGVQVIGVDIQVQAAVPSPSRWVSSQKSWPCSAASRYSGGRRMAAAVAGGAASRNDTSRSWSSTDTSMAILEQQAEVRHGTNPRRTGGTAARSQVSSMSGRCTRQLREHSLARSARLHASRAQMVDAGSTCRAPSSREGCARRPSHQVGTEQALFKRSAARRRRWQRSCSTRRRRAGTCQRRYPRSLVDDLSDQREERGASTG